MDQRLSGSWMALRFVQRSAVLLLLVLAGAAPSSRESLGEDADTFVNDTVQQWCLSHEKREDLQVAVIDVRFRAEPPLFAQGEAVVVAPVALELAGAQRVLEVASRPTSVRRLSAGGITALAWEYAGRVHRDMRFVGLALVERRPDVKPVGLASPTFDTLPADIRPESLARVVDIEEHGLEKCAQFPEWARNHAGDPPFPEQVLRLVRAVAGRVGEGEKEPDDVCAALREGRFQVALGPGGRGDGGPGAGNTRSGFQ
jgi:hypothetical protein